MAEVQAIAALTDKETVGVDDVVELKGGDKPTLSDLPQDYLPFSPSNENETTPRENPSDTAAAAATEHKWVSPNKSDEVPSASSSKENSPSSGAPSAILRENEKSTTSASLSSAVAKEFASIKAEIESEYEADFEPITLDEERPDLDMSIIGERVEIRNEEVVAANDIASNEMTIVASSKDFIKIIHGNKEVMLALPSEASCDLGSTIELTETLATSLGIDDEIVGLETTALMIDEESSTYKQHGQVVIPFSALASGQLRRIIEEAKGVEGIPSFTLVTSSFDSYLEDYQDAALSVAESAGEDSLQSYSAVSVQECALYTEAFVELMQTDEFDVLERNCLLNFGIDNAGGDHGNVLYRAAWRVARYSGDMKYFVQGLKAIAQILLRDEFDDDTTDTKQPTKMTIFGLTDFVICADELYESDDLTAQEYATLLNAIFSGHAKIESLFDLYHNPDFLLACDADDDLRGSLCLHDLLKLAKKLEPMQIQSRDDKHLKWAIQTGIHNFASGMPTGRLPNDFVHIIYHMFSSGDDLVLAACQKFVDTNDSDALEKVLSREYDIYTRNTSIREGESDSVSASSFPSVAKPSNSVLETSLAKASAGIEDNRDLPDCLVTGLLCLVEQKELTEDAAVVILALYAEGNVLLHEIYEQYLEFGVVTDFFDLLKAFAATRTFDSSDQFDTPRLSAALASKYYAADTAESDHTNTIEEIEDNNNAVRSVVDDLINSGALGPVEIAALRLAAVRKDPELSRALSDFREGVLSKVFLAQALLSVAERVVEECC